MSPEQLKPLALTWWEVDELLEHLSSRSDLWTQSSDDPRVWMRTDTRSEPPADAFGLFLGSPTAVASGSFRIFALHAIPMTWSPDYVQAYVLWLLKHWTTYQRRQVVSSFLQSELGVDSGTALIAAIAIDGLDWEDGQAFEPAGPPLQEELWPEDMPTATFENDPMHVGTYLFSGSAGWVRLRLRSGMFHISLALRGKGTPAPLIALQGFVRPLHSRFVDIVTALTGRREVVEPMQNIEPSFPEKTE
jgi:hypothetical protein